MAVSYTHLDVYKRQTLIPAAAANILTKEPPPSKMQQKMVNKYLHLLKLNLQHKWVVFVIAGGVIVVTGIAIASMGTSSVSYTHLDVYKRQHFSKKQN